MSILISRSSADDVVRAQFFGLGSDGTVGANKESIKIIGENTDYFAQGYFVYDSKKSGAMTISHLRFGPRPIRSTYLITKANFVACHQAFLLETCDVLRDLAPGGTFLLNSPLGPDRVWGRLPENAQRRLIEQRAKFFVIDGNKVARDAGMGGRINTVMQTCFFAISGVLPAQQALEAIKNSVRKTYAKKGDEVVEMNLRAIDHTLAHLYEVKIPDAVVPIAPAGNGELKRAPEFVRNVLGEIIAGRGDRVPVSALPNDGTYPTGTTQFEKRNLASEVPVWDPQVCIQCGRCVLVCPHAVIRSKAYDVAVLPGAPSSFKSTEARLPEWKGLKYTLQVAVEDCTGCGICVDVCPARNKSEARLKAINMQPQLPLRETERANWNFFLSIPEMDRRQISTDHVRKMQVQQPLFEFSGACAGCGETPYIKLLTQLFGDRLIIANATGCSSIYGGNLPTTPYTKDGNGRGPAWANSLFEDNAEFGLGFRVSLDKQQEFAGELLQQLSPQIGRGLVTEILNARQRDEADIFDQRERVAELKRRLSSLGDPIAKRLLALADTLVRKSVWIVGGDGWGYDIGYGGLDHVLASGRNVKVLLLDTEVYSNTGGQCSKSTPRAAVAKFASGGKRAPKKDLGLMAMTYGTIYVASVAMGARDEHTLKAFLEAEAYDGPAHHHCLQPLHCARHQHDDGDAKPESSSEHGTVAAVSLQSRAAAARRKSTPARFRRAARESRGLLQARTAVQDPRKERTARCEGIARPGAGRRERAPRALRISRHAKIQHHTKPMNLTTRYLGFKLRTPLVPSASPLSEKIDNIKRMEDAGAAAVVFHSLFEEQIRRDHHDLEFYLEQGTESYAESLSYFPVRPEFKVGPEAYLDHIAQAKAAVDIPIIGSLNGSTVGGWLAYARQIEQAGADALELNIYSIPSDPDISGEDIEAHYLSILAAIKAQVKIPVAMKLSPFFTNFARFARRADREGADGLVLFNRFYQPDIELETLEISPNILLSTPMAMRLPMRWIAMLYGRIGASLAATSGIHRATDALKMLMAGADVTMLCSILLRRGIEHIQVIEREMREWMEEHEYESVEQLKGSMSQKNCPDPSAFERAQYMRALETYPAADI